MESGGNFVVYSMVSSAHDGRTHPALVWETNTSGNNAHLTLQGDGNLVLNDDSGAPWASNTNGDGCNGGCYLIILNDCNLVLYQPGGGVKWASNQFCH